MDKSLVVSKYGYNLPLGQTTIATEEVAVTQKEIKETISQWLLSGWYYNGAIVTNMLTGAVNLYFTALITHTQTAQEAINNEQPIYFMGREVVGQGYASGVFLI
jgi:hypothetical protein